MPLIATEVIYGLSNFIATIMVAHLGQKQLAASALVWSIYLAALLFFIGIFCSVSVMSSQSFGAKDQIGTGICFKQGLIMAIVFALPMMLIILGIPVVLTWAKQDPAVIKYAKPFFYSLIWSILPFNILIVIEHFLIGITKTRLVLFMSILAVPIEVFFYYVFIFGRFGFPKLGIAGVGYGLAVSHFVIATCFVGYLYFSKELRVYSLFKKWWVIEYKFFVEMIRIGLPLGLTWCSELVFFAIVAIMMGTLGVAVLAAYQISYQYLIIALVILFALSHNTAIRIGNEVGRNDRDKIKLAAMVNMMIGFGFVSVFSIFYLFFPKVAIGLDIDINAAHFKDVAVEAMKFFPVVAVLLITECIRLISVGALRGLKDPHFQMVISVFGFWAIAFPSAYLLAFKFKFGGVGIWWGIVIGLFVAGVLLLMRFNRLAKSVDLLSLVTKKE